MALLPVAQELALSLDGMALELALDLALALEVALALELALALAPAADSHEWQGPIGRTGSSIWLGTLDRTCASGTSTKCQFPKTIASTSS